MDRAVGCIKFHTTAGARMSEHMTARTACCFRFYDTPLRTSQPGQATAAHSSLHTMVFLANFVRLPPIPTVVQTRRIHRFGDRRHSRSVDRRAWHARPRAPERHAWLRLGLLIVTEGTLSNRRSPASPIATAAGCSLISHRLPTPSTWDPALRLLLAVLLRRLLLLHRAFGGEPLPLLALFQLLPQLLLLVQEVSAEAGQLVEVRSRDAVARAPRLTCGSLLPPSRPSPLERQLPGRALGTKGLRAIAKPFLLSLRVTGSVVTPAKGP